MSDPLLKKVKEFERKYDYIPYHPRDYTPQEISEQTERDEQDAFDRGER
jgi:hypothetical protein